MFNKLKQAGHRANTSWVLSSMSTKKKKQDLCNHSKKLALAYGFLNILAVKDIVIAENMRMCGDCHTATALLSKA